MTLISSAVFGYTVNVIGSILQDISIKSAKFK